MTEDPRDLDVPSIVAVAHRENKYSALDEMLGASKFFETLEATREKSGKSKEDFLIAIKPNFMMTIRIEDPPLVYTDPELVDGWIDRIFDAGYGHVRVVEAQNVYSLWYRNRSVTRVAQVIGLKARNYQVRDLTTEQFPFDYGGILGQHFVGESWRDADFRISFAKNKTHDVSRCTLVLKNTYGCLPARDKFTEYHRKREVDLATICALEHFPVHFAAIDATWSLDGPLGYKEGFDVLKDADGNSIREGNIHKTDTIIGGRDLLAVEHTGMTKMGLDPAEDVRFYKCAKDTFGERPFEVVGDLTPYEDWLNVGAEAADALDIGEEIPVMSHFLGESMAHVDPVLFPPLKTTWVRKMMHRVGRHFFIRKVRSRRGVRVVAPRK